MSADNGKITTLEGTFTNDEGARKNGARILVLNGPNLNLLGLREPEKYGSTTIYDILTDLRRLTLEELGATSFSHLQTNHEGVLLDRVHAARSDGTTHIVINAGAWTHTSVALRDALLGCEKPFIEVHISNVHAREPFRHHSYLSDKASGIIVGMGAKCYGIAIRHAVEGM